MNPTAIYSKSGKGVQEASGKTSLLKRPDRAVLAAIDGRATLAEVAQKVGRPYDPAFQGLIQQLDKDGFIREVSAGAASSAPLSQPSRPAAPSSRPGAASKPGAEPPSDLDFSSLGTTKIGGVAPVRPAAPPPSRPAAAPPPKPQPPSPQQSQQAKAQQSALDKAREEAEAKAAAERERVRREAEEKAKAEIEARMRVEAEKKMKEEAEARVRAEAEAKVKAAREAAVRAAAEAKAKAEAEAKAKIEAERRAREEMERRLEEERRAREEAERKAREEAERKAREEAERKAREEAERKAREEAERLRREAEEQARKLREEAERKAREEAERVRRELEAERKRLEEERRREEQERAARRQREEEEARLLQEAAAQAAAQAAVAAAAPAAPPEPAAAAKGGSFADSLLADLDSFTNKDEEEQKARQESDRKAKADAEGQRRETAEREAAEARRREEDEQRRRRDEEARREEEQRRAREEEERLAREEERRKREADEIKRKAEAATAAAMAKQAAGGDEDIPISDDDLDLDEIKQERKALGIDEKKERQKAKEAEREAKRKKRAEEKRRREAEKQSARSAAPVPGPRSRRSSSWGRPVALFLAVVLIGALGAAHVVPLDVAPYEQAATEALGQPVRIGSARLWLFTGVQLRFDGVRVGDARIGRVVTHPALGSLFGERRQFNLIELEGLSLPQAAAGSALFSKLKSDRFGVERVAVRNLELTGGLALPKLDADIALERNGTLRSATLHGPDGLNARIAPRPGPRGEVLEFEATAAGFPLPIGPEVTLSQFAMKGSATRQGMDIAEWGGAIFNGGISGTAKLRWGGLWEVDGVVTVRSINAAVFAPALLSQGNAEGTGRFTMSGADPAKLLAASRVDGRFTISQGTLGSFDLSRAIQSRGKQATGTTQFAELTAQGSYDRGTVALRNVTIGAGALNAGANAEISKSGALSGRIVADVKTAAQTLSATLNLGGTVKEPQVRE